METRGQMQDRQRELRALETIAAALALPHLREALAVADNSDYGDDDRARNCKDAIRRAEIKLGI